MCYTICFSWKREEKRPRHNTTLPCSGTRHSHGAERRQIHVFHVVATSVRSKPAARRGLPANNDMNKKKL